MASTSADAEPQDLERHAPVEGGLLGLVDDSHATATDFTDDVEVAKVVWIGVGSTGVGVAGGAVDEIDAGEAGFEGGGQLRVVKAELAAVGGLAGLEVRHVLVEDRGELRGRVGSLGGTGTYRQVRFDVWRCHDPFHPRAVRSLLGRPSAFP